ncbi:hypothetical protein HK103_004285 [Boothiomyces macroporosus]|uniref:Uncharacterized protein n=1 Tax=Boothiomyces macroporosus TaxID=261099 RepID=A0AAD5UGW7_9FUNG|nr:hypothetical protein HK103_004285 [Boothiomyces macroporosus]
MIARFSVFFVNAVYDIERREVLHEIQGHSNDVNSVGFVDPLDPNVLVSGSDDHLIKIWDRRSLGAACIPSGVLIGHTEGITYVSPKGDGRHILSNGKDQAMKLWDIRRMASGSKKDYSETIDYCPPWDYRWMKYPLKSPLKHPKDCSVKTFVGHSVLKTLIRCHFSPCSNYTYTGSADGIIHIYSLQGNEKHRINTNSVKFGRSRHARDSRGLVRDVSWHPNAPYLICGQWLEDGGRLLKYDPAFE